MGLLWVNRAGVITIIFAAGFFFKLAIQNRWIGELGRVSLGVAVAALALAAGERFWRADQKVYAQGISAAGIGVLYLSIYAAFSLYHLLAVEAAFCLLVLVTATAVGLATRYNSPAMAALGLLGGYLTPLLLRVAEDAAWFFLGYVLLLDLGALAVSRIRQWRRLDVLAVFATMVLYLSWHARQLDPANRLPATLFTIFCYALFAAMAQKFAFLGSQVFFMLVAAAVWAPALAPYLLLALGLLVSGLVVADRRQWADAVSITFASFWISYALWYSWYRSPRPLEPIFFFLTIVFLCFLGWAPWRLLFRKFPLRHQDLLLVPINAAIYFAVSYYLLEPSYRAYMGLFAVAAAAAHMLVGYWLRQAAPRGDHRPSLLCAGAAWCFLTLAVPIQFQGFRITIIWALEGAALAWIRVRTKEVRLIYPALAVFGFVLLRLGAIDAWMYSAPQGYATLGNLRFLTFFIAAISFWAAAFWIKRGRIALAIYVAGHGIILWGLSLELFGWAARTTGAENLRSVESTSVSILLGTYAVLLVVFGLLNRSAADRWLGLGLIATVVVKLYLYDVWLLGLLYRVTAFAVLGVLLLLMSLFYSRYRSSIESWWREET